MRFPKLITSATLCTDLEQIEDHAADNYLHQDSDPGLAGRQFVEVACGREDPTWQPADE